MSSREKRKTLTLVYVDYGSTFDSSTKEIDVTPEILDPLLNNLSTDTDFIRRYFVFDFRGAEKEHGVEDINKMLMQWTLYGYESITCHRTVNMTKETIDVNAIEKIHRDVDLFRESYELHVILVTGDSDYFNLISTLLDRYGARVSIIATNRNASLRRDLLKKCHACYALFRVDDLRDHTFQGFDLTASNTLTGTSGNFQEYYEPTRAQVDRYQLFCNTHFTCPYCGEDVLTGHFSAHPCLAQNPPPGILTRPHAISIANRLSSLHPKKLLEWFVKRRAEEALPGQIAFIVDQIINIPWPTVNVVLSLIRIEETGLAGLPVSKISDEQSKLLVSSGFVERNGDSLRSTDRAQAIARLKEVVIHRTHYLLTMQTYAPEGAIEETVLRERLMKQFMRSTDGLSCPQLCHSQTDNDPNTVEEDPLWDSDHALCQLTRPDCTQTERKEMRDTRDPIHPVNYWYELITKLPQQVQEDDLLCVIERILTDNPFATTHSVEILVSNGILLLERETESFAINRNHPFFQIECNHVAA